MLSNVNIVIIISRSPPGMKSVMHRPLGQPQQRIVAFQVRQIYPPSPPISPFLFYRLVMCFNFWISMKRWQTCKSSLRFWFVEANMLFLPASESIKPNAVSSVMWASFREDNAIQRRREAAGARHCALSDRYRFSRRSHFGVEWLFRFVRLTLSGCVIVTWRSDFRPSVRKNAQL